MNETHNPDLRSWVESANTEWTDFPIQNLPFGVFSRGGGTPSVGVAIGDMVLDLVGCGEAGLLAASPSLASCASASLNPLMALERSELSRFRSEISALLSEGSQKVSSAKSKAGDILFRADDVRLHVPVTIGDYTDFYASIHHATNVGSMFRPDNPLLPNYKYVPIGYHGRASSIVGSGSAVRRPKGQLKPADAPSPSFGASKMLDYESELGFYVGKGNELGTSISIDDARPWYPIGTCL